MRRGFYTVNEIISLISPDLRRYMFAGYIDKREDVAFIVPGSNPSAVIGQTIPVVFDASGKRHDRGYVTIEDKYDLQTIAPSAKPFRTFAFDFQDMGTWNSMLRFANDMDSNGSRRGYFEVKSQGVLYRISQFGEVYHYRIMDGVSHAIPIGDSKAEFGLKTWPRLLTLNEIMYFFWNDFGSPIEWEGK